MWCLPCTSFWCCHNPRSGKSSHWMWGNAWVIQLLTILLKNSPPVTYSRTKYTFFLLAITYTNIFNLHSNVILCKRRPIPQCQRIIKHQLHTKQLCHILPRKVAQCLDALRASWSIFLVWSAHATTHISFNIELFSRTKFVVWTQRTHVMQKQTSIDAIHTFHILKKVSDAEGHVNWWILQL